MNVNVRLPSALRQYAGGQESVSLEGNTVGEILKALTDRHAPLKRHLLDEKGYLQEPHQHLIGLKRQMWRNLRAALDVELQTGRVTLDQGAKQIEAIGFSSRRAQRQIRRFCLTPGYQLCYAMGMHEVLRLRRRFSSHLTLKTFHDIFLEGGQLPFHLVERRLAASGAKNLTG